jgi:hypothetical protein
MPSTSIPSLGFTEPNLSYYARHYIAQLSRNNIPVRSSYVVQIETPRKRIQEMRCVWKGIARILLEALGRRGKKEALK